MGVLAEEAVKRLQAKGSAGRRPLSGVLRRVDAAIVSLRFWHRSRMRA